VSGMSERSDLQDRFRRLAMVVPQKASPEVEKKLRLVFRRRFSSTRRLWNYGRKVAAGIAIPAGLYVIWTRAKTSSNESTRDDTRSDHTNAAIATVREMPGFIALPYSQSDVPMEEPVIVRVQIPVSELAVIGMQPAPIAARDRISADFLVGQDGVARAVRVAQQ